jgi:hypothetical protein
VLLSFETCRQQGFTTGVSRLPATPLRRYNQVRFKYPHRCREASLSLPLLSSIRFRHLLPLRFPFFD